MADTVHTWAPAALRRADARPTTRRGFAKFLRQRSTIAFLMCLPLIGIIFSLVCMPPFYLCYVSMLNKSQTRFLGLGTFTYLLSRDVFWMVVWQSAVFALS